MPGCPTAYQYFTFIRSSTSLAKAPAATVHYSRLDGALVSEHVASQTKCFLSSMNAVMPSGRFPNTCAEWSRPMVPDWMGCGKWSGIIIIMIAIIAIWPCILNTMK